MKNHKVSAIVLAAGLSTRMGKPKMLLPWGKVTVIEAIIRKLKLSKIDEIVVVVGAEKEGIECVLKRYAIIQVFNPEYINGSMLNSLQVGLRVKKPENSIMVFPGDHPGIKKSTIEALIRQFEKTPSQIIIPSFQMHKGHPWIVPGKLTGEIAKLQEPVTLKEFLSLYESIICYVPTKDKHILLDLDTPEDYQLYKPD